MPLVATFKIDLIDFLTGNGSFTPPSQWYLGLLIDGAEVGAGWYGRQAVNFGAATTYAANTNAIAFNMVTTDSGTMTAVALYGAAATTDPLITSGTMSPASISLSPGTIIKIAAGTVRVF